MAYTTQYTGYVKFVRGTPDAWNSLPVKDTNTLYFVAEPDAEKGVLYLGDREIAGKEKILTLESLANVLISEQIPTNSLLAYDGGKWVNKSLNDIFSLVVGEMIGATDKDNGDTGLVPAPKAGEHTLFLQGNGKWANPTAQVEQTIESINGEIKSLNDLTSVLVGEDFNKSIREIAASETAKIVDGASEAFDTLLEVEQWIEDNKEVADLASLMAKVDNIDDTVFGVEASEGVEAQPGLVDIVSNLDLLINGNENDVKGVLREIDALEVSLGSLEDEVGLINDELDAIDQRLQWQDLVEE